MTDWTLMADYKSPHEEVPEMVGHYAPRFGLKAWRGPTPPHFGGCVLAIEEIKDFVRHKEVILVDEKHEAISLLNERLEKVQELYRSYQSEKQARAEIDESARAAMNRPLNFGEYCGVAARRLISKQESASNPIDM